MNYFCRLLGLPPSQFCQHLNQTQLEECLNILFHLYYEVRQHDGDLLKSTKWSEMEALHVLVSEKGTSEVISRALQVTRGGFTSNKLMLATNIATSLWLGNFVRAHRLARNLPLLLQLAYHLKLAGCRPTILDIYYIGYKSVAGTKFPLSKLSELLLLHSPSDTKAFCHSAGLVVDESGPYVVFKTGNAPNSSGVKEANGRQYLSAFLLEERLSSVSANSDLLFGKAIWTRQQYGA